MTSWEDEGQSVTERVLSRGTKSHVDFAITQKSIFLQTIVECYTSLWATNHDPTSCSASMARLGLW